MRKRLWFAALIRGGRFTVYPASSRELIAAVARIRLELEALRRDK